MNLNKRTIYKFLGIMFMTVGIIGVFLPVFPTTPFILLAAWFFFNSSPRLFMWLINNRFLGLQLYIYLKYRSIELRSKISAMLFLWTSGAVTMQFIERPHVKMIMFFIFTAVTIHVFSYPNLQAADKHEASSKYHARFKRKKP